MKPITGLKITITIGLGLFFASFLLPAYSLNSKIFYGYQCAYIAPGAAISGSLDGGIIAQFFTRVHYFFLGLHNVILLVGLLVTKKIVRGKYAWVLYFLFITTLNAIGFFFYNHFVDSVMKEVLHIGYYVWIVSSMLILISLIVQKRGQLDS